MAAILAAHPVMAEKAWQDLVRGRGANAGAPGMSVVTAAVLHKVVGCLGNGWRAIGRAAIKGAVLLCYGKRPAPGSHSDPAGNSRTEGLALFQARRRRPRRFRETARPPGSVIPPRAGRDVSGGGLHHLFL